MLPSISVKLLLLLLSLIKLQFKNYKFHRVQTQAACNRLNRLISLATHTYQNGEAELQCGLQQLYRYADNLYTNAKTGIDLRARGKLTSHKILTDNLMQTSRSPDALRRPMIALSCSIREFLSETDVKSPIS